MGRKHEIKAERKLEEKTTTTNNNNTDKSSTAFINVPKEHYLRCAWLNLDNEKSTDYLPYIVRGLMDRGKNKERELD